MNSSYIDILHLPVDYSYHFDIVWLCEIVLCVNQSFSLYSFPVYNLHVKNRTSLGRGGISLLLKEGIRSGIRDDPSIWGEGKLKTFSVDIEFNNQFFFKLAWCISLLAPTWMSLPIDLIRSLIKSHIMLVI